MTAQALLSNPTLYLGLSCTPYTLVKQFVDYCFMSPIPLPLVIHHLGEMCSTGGRLGKKGRGELNEVLSWVQLVEWLEEWGRKQGEGGVDVGMEKLAIEDKEGEEAEEEVEKS